MPVDRLHREHNFKSLDRTALNAVGILTTTPGGNATAYGSGWLAVDTCHVITAEHVLYGLDFDETAPLGIPVYFYVGQADRLSVNNYGFVRGYSGRVVARGKAVQHDDQADAQGRDWAVIRLDESVERIKPLKVEGHDSETFLGANVLAAGYPQLLLSKEGVSSAGRQLWADQGPIVGGHAMTGDEDFVVYEAQLQLGSGQSGGPVVAVEGDPAVALGLVQAVSTSSALTGSGDLAGLDISPGHPNRLVMFGIHAAQVLRDIIRNSPCSAPSR